MKSLSFATLVAISLATVSATNVAQAGQQCAGEGFQEVLECPQGYQCENIDPSYSECTPEHHSIYSAGRKDAHLHSKRQAMTRVTGPTVGKNERWPVQRMAAENPDVYNMFILGLYAMQRLAENNIYSYYEVAGIHGAPYKSWGEDQTPANPLGLGYCTHNSALFATWHRPYLSFIEQRIHVHAIQEAQKFANAQHRARFVAAAQRVRLPYWDWSSNGGRLPTQLMQATVQVINARSSDGAAQRVTINNPLYSYRFTSNRKNTDLAAVPAVRDQPMTVRWPTGQSGVSNNAAASNSAANGYSSRRQNTYNLFSITRFNQFSNSAFREGGNPATFNNVESIHNNIHNDMGGPGGHMTYVVYSAFDPVFFLHHCNIDRLVAMYQAARPGLAVTPQSPSRTWMNPRPTQNDDVNTPLWPFRKNTGQLYTSRDVSSASSIWALNYAYPEVPYRFNGRPASELQSFTRGRVNALYGPTSAQKKAKRDTDIDAPEVEMQVPADAPKKEFLLHCVFNGKDLNDGDTVMVYFGKPSDDLKSRRTEENLIGTIASFSATEGMDMLISGTVPLTGALEKYGVGLDPNSTVPYLDSDLEWVVMSKDNKEIPIENIPSLKIGISSADINYVDGLKEFGEWETYYEITKDIPGGVEPGKDEELVESVPAPPIVALLDEVEDGVKEIVDKIKEKKQRYKERHAKWLKNLKEEKKHKDLYY